MKQELEIQKFLKAKTAEGLSFEEIKEILFDEPYRIAVHDNNELAIFKYAQIGLDWNETICRECRGLILEKGTWKVVRYAFDKFFNLGEKYAASIDWGSAVGTEKIDGTLISLYYYKGKWHVATNGTIDAYTTHTSASVINNGKYKNFGELWEAAVKINYPDFFSHGINKLDKDCTYTFELVSPYNKIVISYDKPMVYHIATRNNITFEEIEANIGIEKPKEYKLFGQKEFIEYVKYHMNGTHEGIVVRDKFYNRVKIKTELYLELSYQLNSFFKGTFKSAVNVPTILKIIMQNEQSELLAYFPEYKPYFDDIEAQWKLSKKIIDEVKQFTSDWKQNNPTLPKITFINYVNENIAEKRLRTLYISAYDNKIDVFIERLPVWKYINIFDIKVTI